MKGFEYSWWKKICGTGGLLTLRHANKITVQRQIWCCPHSLLMQSTYGYGHPSPEIPFSFLLKFSLAAGAHQPSHSAQDGSAIVGCSGTHPFEFRVSPQMNDPQLVPVLGHPHSNETVFLCFEHLLHFHLCPLLLELSVGNTEKSLAPFSSFPCIRYLSMHVGKTPINLL